MHGPTLLDASPNGDSHAVTDRPRLERKTTRRFDSGAAHGNDKRPPAKPVSASGAIFIFLFGVLLPAGTLAFELATNACASDLFDPIPTLFHVLLVGLVPAANLVVLVFSRRLLERFPRTLTFFNACAIGVALFYSLLFLPLTPFAVIGLMFGIGFLPLAPLFSLIAAVRCRRVLQLSWSETTPVTPLPSVWTGLCAGLGLLVLGVAHQSVTDFGIQMATSTDGTRRATGLRLLRTIGTEQGILRACYMPRTWFSNPFGFVMFDRVPQEKVTELYYRVTGKAFNEAPVPKRRGMRGDFWDFGRGGTSVAGRVDGLALSSSRMDGVVEPKAATAYVEWTMVFRNDTRSQQEARAQIALPAGGAVSRVTLWINGEEREAAFGGRGEVRAAYESVVQQHRDPLLVTTCGPNRVLVQCFPVPPAGEMKIRLGMSLPLALSGRDATFQLPRVIERNFDSTPSQDVWLESPQALVAAGYPSETAKPGVLRLQLPEPDARPVVISTAQPDVTREVWTEDRLQPNEFAITQRFESREVKRPARIVIVVDGSKAMGPNIPKVADAIEKLPAGIPFRLLLAGDGVEEFSSAFVTGSDEAKKAADWLRQRSYPGGCDNLPALQKAWDQVSSSDATAMVWVHGSQPVLLSSAEPLLQRTERDPNPPALYSIQLAAGPDRISEQLEKFEWLEERAGTTAALDDLMSEWRGEARQWTPIRERIKLDTAAPRDPVNHGSSHIARLWAVGEVKRLRASRAAEDARQAVALATRHQIVTPVSGAVVLETQEQYKRAGLEAVDPATTPSIPEPGTVALLIAGAALLLFVPAWQRRRTATR